MRLPFSYNVVSRRAQWARRRWRAFNLDTWEYFRHHGARRTFERARACIGRRKDAAAVVALGIDGIRPRHVPQIGRGSGGTGNPTVDAALYRMTTAREIYGDACVRLAEIDAFRRDAARLAEGAGKALGWTYGAVLRLYYIEGLRWDEVRGRLGGRGLRQILRMRDTACEWADSVGYLRAVRGLGDAT